MGGAGSGGGSVSRNDVVLTPVVHVDVVGLRPVLWAVEAAPVPGRRFAGAAVGCAGADQRPVVEVGDHRPAIGEEHSPSVEHVGGPLAGGRVWG